MKKSILFLFLGTLFLSLSAQTRPIKPNINNRPFPFQNPVIRHMYTADPAPKVMPDGKIWMVTSVDHEDGGGYATMHCYHSFSTSDMKTWTDHGVIFDLNDALQGEPEPEGEDWALWAPAIIFKDGKFFLFYPVRIANVAKKSVPGDIGDSYIAVAVSDNPAKRFSVVNPKIQGTEGIDPAVFIDDDGQPYLYWGICNMAKLKENMTELAESPHKIEVGTDKFMEAVWMNKHQGKYYISYHTLYDWKLELTPELIKSQERKRSELGYSVGDSPYGPFTYKGTMNYEPGEGIKREPQFLNNDIVPWRLTLSNHGGIVEYHGQEYLFYHNSALSSWRQDEFKERGTWTQRSVCVDSLNYNNDSTIIPVKQTLSGVSKIDINQPYEIVVQKGAKKVFAGKILKFENVNLGSGYYYFGIKASQVNQPLTAKVFSGSEKGELLGTVKIKEECIACTFLRNANGIKDIYLIFDGKAKVSNLNFFAGSPTK